MSQYHKSKEFDHEFRKSYSSLSQQNYFIQDTYKASQNCYSSNYNQNHLGANSIGNHLYLNNNSNYDVRIFQTYDETQKQPNSLNKFSYKKLSPSDNGSKDDFFSFGVDDAENSKFKTERKNLYKESNINKNIIAEDYHKNDEIVTNNTLDLDNSYSIHYIDGDLNSINNSEFDVQVLNSQDDNKIGRGTVSQTTADTLRSQRGNILSNATNSIIQFETLGTQNLKRAPMKVNTKPILNRTKFTPNSPIIDKISVTQDIKEIQHVEYIASINQININKDLIYNDRENIISIREIINNKMRYEDIHMSQSQKVLKVPTFTSENFKFNETKLINKCNRKQESFQTFSNYKLHENNEIDIIPYCENFENNQSNNCSELEQIVILSSRVVNDNNSCREKPFTPPRYKHEEALPSKSYTQKNISHIKENLKGYTPAPSQRHIPNDFEYCYEKTIEYEEEQNEVNPTSYMTYNKEQTADENIEDSLVKIDKINPNILHYKEKKSISSQSNYASTNMFEIESKFEKNYPILSKSLERSTTNIVPNLNHKFDQQSDNNRGSKVLYINQYGMNHNLKSTQLVCNKAKTPEIIHANQTNSLFKRNVVGKCNLTDKKIATPPSAINSYKSQIFQYNQSQNSTPFKKQNDNKIVNPFTIYDSKSDTKSNGSKFDSIGIPNQMPENHPNFYLNIDTLTNALLVPEEHPKDSKLLQKDINQFCSPMKKNDLSTLKSIEHKNNNRRNYSRCMTEKNINQYFGLKHHHQKSTDVIEKKKSQQIGYVNDINSHIYKNNLQKTPMKIQKENIMEHQYFSSSDNKIRLENIKIFNKNNITTTPQKGIFTTYRN